MVLLSFRDFDLVRENELREIYSCCSYPTADILNLRYLNLCPQEEKNKVI